MCLSINTDILSSQGNPFPTLKKIAKKGFKYIQWIHHWNTDFIYNNSEINEIKSRLNEYGLILNDIHASIGVEKIWFSENEYQRKAGFELVKNRIEMTAELGGDVIVLHPFKTPDPELYDIHFKQGEKSLNELKAVSMNNGVKIALENLTLMKTLTTIEKYFDIFDDHFLGFCWDTGHTNNLKSEAIDYAEKFTRERLIALHINDNMGDGRDIHAIPFSGSADWDKITKIISESSYPETKPLTFEVNHLNEKTVEKFLEIAFEKGKIINEMVKEYRMSYNK